MKCNEISPAQKKKDALLKRISGVYYLHPEFAAIIYDLQLAIAQQKMPFKVYETYRTPQRQKKLISLGLSKERNYLDNPHVNGLAVDFLLDYRAVRSFEKSDFAKLTSSDLASRQDPVSQQFGLVYNLGANVLQDGTVPPRTVVRDQVVLDFWNNLGTLIERQYPELVWGGTFNKGRGQLIGTDAPHVEMKGAHKLIRQKTAIVEIKARGNPGLEVVKI